jgi:hypothetical protein
LSKNHKSEFFTYFSKSSSNVAASEIQNLKNSPDFSKMQKIATKNSRLFLVRSDSFFQKQRFLWKMTSFFRWNSRETRKQGLIFWSSSLVCSPKGRSSRKHWKMVEFCENRIPKICVICA